MPYINKLHQALFDEHIDKLFKLVQDKEGNIDYGALEYTIFRLVQKLAEKKMKFVNLNALVGVLETTKAEVLRRILGPHEDLKLIENWKGTNGSNE